jgi:hypothetical protein
MPASTPPPLHIDPSTGFAPQQQYLSAFILGDSLLLIPTCKKKKKEKWEVGSMLLSRAFSIATAIYNKAFLRL